MFEPITLPSTISVEPSDKALIEIANSGADVPKATIVKPISAFGTLQFAAVDDAPSTNQSAPLINNTNPTIKIRTCKTISMKLLYQAYGLKYPTIEYN